MEPPMPSIPSLPPPPMFKPPLSIGGMFPLRSDAPPPTESTLDLSIIKNLAQTPIAMQPVMTPPPKPAGFHPPAPKKPVLPPNIKTNIGFPKPPLKNTLTKADAKSATSASITLPIQPKTNSSTSMMLPAAGGMALLLFFLMRK